MKRLLTLLALILCLTAGDFKRSRPAPDPHIPSLPGVTLWLDASEDLTKITYDAQRRVGTWASRVGSISFTQATAGNKPVRTVGSSVENLFTYSDDATGATWDTASYPVGVSGTTITADNSDNYHCWKPNNISVVAGQSYVTTLDVAYSNYAHFGFGHSGDAAWHYQAVDLSAGSLGTSTNVSSTITDLGSGRYKIASTWTATNTVAALGAWICFGTATNNTSPPSWAAAGTEIIEFHSAQVRHANSSPAYVATTDHAIHRGSPSGMSGVWFDESNDEMTSTSTLGDIFAAGDKTVFIVYRGNGNSGRLLGTTSGVKWIAYIQDGSPDSFTVYNDDGSADYIGASYGSISDTAVIVAESWQTGGAARACVNSICGTEAATGNTSATTDAIMIGDDNGASELFGGDILEIITANKAWDSGTRAKVRRYLCKKWGADC